MGVKNVQFEELISLEPSLLASLSPLGVIFLFKYRSEGRKASEPLDGKFDADAANSGKVWFAAQTIQNACGTQALLSVLLNKDEKEGVSLGPHLGDFKEFTGEFPPDVRAPSERYTKTI